MKARADAYRLGLAAETIAAWGLRLRGYRIVARRYKTKVGEIDLIASRGKTLVFIEVKARGDIAAALQAVTPHMQARICRAAQSFIAQNVSYGGYDMRFDLIALAPPFHWRHLDNAFRPLA